jgi:hypothetical protein
LQRTAGGDVALNGWQMCVSESLADTGLWQRCCSEQLEEMLH